MDDMKFSHQEISCVLFEMLGVEVEKMSLELSGGKEGKNKLEVSNPYLRQRLGVRVVFVEKEG